jgi:hypothetical protein
MTSDPELAKAYRRYNRIWFRNRLPSLDRVVLYWDSIPGLDGECSDDIIPGKWVIRIQTAFAGWSNQWRIVLAHELAHLANWPYEKHGPKFDAEIQRLTKFKSYRKLL